MQDSVTSPSEYRKFSMNLFSMPAENNTFYTEGRPYYMFIGKIYMCP